MKPEEQRVAIAEFCGWNVHAECKPGYGYKDYRESSGGWGEEEETLPDYLSDLNAMHEAVIRLEEKRPGLVSEYIYQISYAILRQAGLNPLGFCSEFRRVHATAAHQAEALLRTIGKWTEEPTQTKES